MTLGAENDQIDLTGLESPEVPAEDVTETPAATEPETPVEQQAETPEPEPTPPPAAAPQTDWAARMDRMMAMQEQDMLARQQQAEEQRRQQAEAARPKPLMEQPEWQERYAEAMERMTYDADARRTYMSMTSELAREQARAEIAPIQQQFQMEARGDTVLREATAAIRQEYGDMVPEAMFAETANRLFSGNRAAIAQALDPQNPQSAETRQYIADLVVGRQFREGKLRTPNTPKPPPNPRSPARSATPTPSNKSEADMWNDQNHLDGVWADLYRRKA